MKKIYLVRHAKSSWKDPLLDDVERPLNNRGKRDAPFMGNILKQLEILPDKVLTSPAKRAKKTAKMICREISYPSAEIRTSRILYEHSIDEVLELIQKTDDDINSIMLVGHNPTLTSLNNYLSDIRIDNIPTCGIVFLEFKTDVWKDVGIETGKLVTFEYPKKYLI